MAIRFDPNQLLDKIKKGASTVGKKAGELRDTTRLSFAINAKESELADLYRELGQSVYESARGESERMTPETIMAMIDACLEELDALKGKKSELTAPPVCTVCGRDLPKNARFCPACGAHVEEDGCHCSGNCDDCEEEDCSCTEPCVCGCRETEAEEAVEAEAVVEEPVAEEPAPVEEPAPEKPSRTSSMFDSVIPYGPVDAPTEPKPL